MNKLKIGIIFILVFLLAIPNENGQAQTEPDYPFYIVQSGDTLGVVAERFGTTVDELINLNELANPDSLAVGTELKIPGFEGITGEMVLHTVNLGESYQYLTKRNELPSDMLSKLNRLVSPEELFVGSRLIIPMENEDMVSNLFTIQPSDHTPLETAVAADKNPWYLYLSNPDVHPAQILPGDEFYLPGEQGTEESSLSIPGVSALEITPLPFVQGKTIEIKITSISPLDLQANIGGKPVEFFKTGENQYVALHGISAVDETGLISIELGGSQAGQPIFSVDQRILVESGYYGTGPAITVDPATILPENTDPEQALVEGITNQVNPERYWNGIFQYPVDEPCMNAGFGSSRIYNGTFEYYHTGIDFSVCTANNTNIYAAAPGRVVLAEGPLVVRGNAVIIDHGWGVYTGYWHQSSLAVKVGDYVQAGQLLGTIGTTGRSTGYHLHFEIWVNGAQVDPTDWLTNEYP